MNSWLRKRVLVFTGTLHLWDIDGRTENVNAVTIKAEFISCGFQVVRNW